MMALSLNAWINQALVGVLSEQNNLWSFTLPATAKPAQKSKQWLLG